MRYNSVSLKTSYTVQEIEQNQYAMQLIIDQMQGVKTKEKTIVFTNPKNWQPAKKDISIEDKKQGAFVWCRICQCRKRSVNTYQRFIWRKSMSSNCFLPCPVGRISQGKSTEWHVMKVNFAKNKDFLVASMSSFSSKLLTYPH